MGGVHVSRPPDELAVAVEYIRACAMSRGCRDALNKMADELEQQRHIEWWREGLMKRPQGAK